LRVFSKFLGQQVVSWREEEIKFQEDIIYLVSQVIVFYKGAITYKEILEMPLAELDMIIKARNKIIKQNVV
jgi:hypothetical protein